MLVAGGVAGCVPAYEEPVGDDACAVQPTDEEAAAEPELIAIEHDDYKAEHIGRTADGRQFFLTEPFERDRGFVALYLFDADGTLDEARIDPDADGLYERRLTELGAVTYGRIAVKPFEVDRFGLTFGLVSRIPEGGGGIRWVSAEPGDYMAFTAPWDCGLYDT
ncbi:hypothetical protein GCM10009828_079980 [Actinoplanes couchii]|uniref:Uncharacterized protein n=1 Tax=Actinoplanes couchii TaxID=403638 RepID=A0ABQ3XFW6_9ACTN|nr:hypothetical protein Aco03nite_057800 [Actinoplanes couchii]